MQGTHDDGGRTDAPQNGLTPGANRAHDLMRAWRAEWGTPVEREARDALELIWRATRTPEERARLAEALSKGPYKELRAEAPKAPLPTIDPPSATPYDCGVRGCERLMDAIRDGGLRVLDDAMSPGARVCSIRVGAEADRLWRVFRSLWVLPPEAPLEDRFRIELRTARDWSSQTLRELNTAVDLRDGCALWESTPTRGTPSPPPKASRAANRACVRSGLSAGEVESSVSRCIRQWREGSEPLSSITRDRIARSTGVSAGRVSNTKAWKAVAAEKRSAATKPRRLGAAPIDVDEAIERGDWDAVQECQEREARDQTRHG